MIAYLLIGVQCFVGCALLLFVRRFGQYAKETEATHRSNQELIAWLYRDRQERSLKSPRLSPAGGHDAMDPDHLRKDGAL